MSVKVSALCWKVALPATEKLVLLRLADFADDKGFNIYPAVHTVADDCGVGRRVVQLTLRRLVDKGLLVVMNMGGGRRRTTEYAIDLEALKAAGTAPPGAPTYTNGHAGKGANSESRAPFMAQNSAPRAPFPNSEKGEKGASDDINSAPRAPNPLEPPFREEESVCSVDSNSAREPVPPQASPLSAEIIPIKEPLTGGPAVPLPDNWALPDDWAAWAEAAGQGNVSAAGGRFFDFHFERGIAKTAAGWRRAWERWINQNIQRGYGDGQQRHYGKQKPGNGLVAYAHAEMQRNPGFAQDHPDDGDWRVIRG